MANIRNPWAPPEKVHDEHAVGALTHLADRIEVVIELLKMQGSALASLQTSDPEPVDLTPLLDAIRNIRPAEGGVTEAVLPPEALGQIAQAVRAPMEELGQTLEAMAEKVTQAGMQRQPTILGGGGGSMQNKSGVRIDPATEDTLLDVKRSVTDYETRLDYDVRTDSNPVYLGKAAAATATSADGWHIQKFTYDASDRTTRIEVAEGAWDDRTILF